MELDCKGLEKEKLISKSIKELERNYKYLEKEKKENGDMFYKLKLENLESDNNLYEFSPGSQIEWSIKQELNKRAEEIENEPKYKKFLRYFKDTTLSEGPHLFGKFGDLFFNLMGKGGAAYGIYSCIQKPSISSDILENFAKFSPIFFGMSEEGIRLWKHKKKKKKNQNSTKIWPIT